MRNIAYSKAAVKYLMRLQPKRRQAVAARLKAVAAGQAADIKPLVGRPGFFRVRIGALRAICKWSDDRGTLEVHAVGPRGDVYHD